MSEKKRDPGLLDKAFPEAYTVPPPQPKEKKPGQLTPDQVKQFFEDGFILLEDFFRPEELEPVTESVEKQVDEVASALFKQGRIKNTYKELPVGKRLIELEKEFPTITAVMVKKQILDENMKKLWTNERLLNVMEQILGSEVAVHPVWSYRTKTPHNTIIAVPWHQDNAYFGMETYDHMIPVAWIPLHDTNTKIGCLQMARGGHKQGRVIQHTGLYKDAPYIILEEEVMEKELGIDLKKDVVTCPVPYGGVLLFTNVTPHQALNNWSDDTRISFDLRFQSAHHPFGYYGIQDGTLVRSAKNPTLEVNWDQYKTDRKVIWEERFLKEEYKTDDEFDATITGPWLGKWTLKHKNRHSEAYKYTL